MKQLAPLLASLPDKNVAATLSNIFTGLYERMRCVLFTTSALTGGTASATAVTAATATLIVGGILRQVASGTSMAALVGTVTNAAYNVFVFSVDKSGVLYTQMGVQSTALTGVKFPSVQENRTVLGFIIIHPTGAGNFVGGTTAFDSVTVVPNATFINTIGAFDPSATI